MDWDDVKYFLAVARNGSLSKAAISLNVNVTTVSRRIVALEKTLKVRLFERLQSGYSPTQAGEDILQQAGVMEEAALAIDLTLYGRDACLKGKLVLTVEAIFANTMIIPHLAEFTTRYPEIDLEVITDSSLTDMNMREADIAVRITPNPPEDLVGRKICELGHGIYASKRYLAVFNERKQKYKESLLHADADQVPQMQGHCLVLWTDSDGNPPWVKDNFSNTRIAAKFSSPGSILKAVKSHMGIARIPCSLAELDPDLVRLPAKLAPSTWHIWILSRPELRTTERVRVFRNFLFDTLNQQKDLLQGNV